MTTTAFHENEQLSLAASVCAAPCDRPFEGEGVDRYELVFVRRGVFAVIQGRREFLATPNEALLFSPGVDYRVRHPEGKGDECTVIGFSHETAEQLGLKRSAGASHRSIPIDTALFSEQQSLLAAAATGRASTLEIEERLLEVATSAAALAGSRDSEMRLPAPSLRRNVGVAREFIATRFEQSLPLATIGDAAALSRFHLSRAFRRMTGTSMHQYQTQLRVRAAIARLADGASDLTSLALDLGFSSHSHFTTTFRHHLGVSPTDYRRRLRRSSDRITTAARP